MNPEKLSLRLSSVVKFIQQYGKYPINLADIGTDHAYLPVYLCNNQMISKAVAGDVVQGPYLSALKEVESNGLSDRISVRLGSGLQVIQREDQINVITICGMGGKLISEILDDGFEILEDKTLLVLQANNGEAQLRQWLQQKSVHIINEEILEEDQHIYEIIVATINQDLVPRILSPEDIYLGPFNRKVANKSFKKKWTGIYQRNQEIIAAMMNAKNPNHDKIQSIKEVNEMIVKGLEANES